MRESILKKSDLPIDLTSLLDVIFIVLLVVLCNQMVMNDKVEKQAVATASAAAMTLEQAKLMRDDATAEANLIKADAYDAIQMEQVYKQQLANYANADSFISFITVYVDYNPVTIEKRHIRVLLNDSEIKTINLNKDNRDEAIDEFYMYLVDFIQVHTDGPIVMSVNLDQILYRDEKVVSATLRDLSGKYNNVYLKEE